MDGIMWGDRCRRQRRKCCGARCARRWLFLVLWEIRAVAPEQPGHVSVEHVDLAADLLRLPRRQPADAEVRVQAADHALEQLLVGLERDGEELLLVGRETADQA